MEMGVDDKDDDVEDDDDEDCDRWCMRRVCLLAVVGRISPPAPSILGKFVFVVV